MFVLERLWKVSRQYFPYLDTQQPEALRQCK